MWVSAYLEVDLHSVDKEEDDHDEHEDSIATVKHMAEKSLSFTKKKKKKEMDVEWQHTHRQWTPSV